MSQDSTSSADTDNEILDRYQTIHSYSQMMQCYVRDGDWDRLIDLQTVYVSAVEALADAEVGVRLSEADTQRKRELILEIQQAETEIREALEHRLDELSQEMSDSRQRRNALQAYRSQD